MRDRRGGRLQRQRTTAARRATDDGWDERADGHFEIEPPPTTSPTPPKPDSGKTTPPTTNPGQPGPDTAGTVKRSTEPRAVSGTVIGMGPASDSANYQKVAGATVVWTSADGKELARAVTGADGSYTLGSFKPATYKLTVTPPSNGPFKGIEWAFIISEYSPEKVDITVWLGRK